MSVRLDLAAHIHQLHPDYRYCVTLDGGSHHDLDGWEPNPALTDGYRAAPNADQYRPEHEPRERYWMRRTADATLDEAERVVHALHAARRHPGFEYTLAKTAPEGWGPNPARLASERLDPYTVAGHYARPLPEVAA